MSDKGSVLVERWVMRGEQCLECGDYGGHDSDCSAYVPPERFTHLLRFYDVDTLEDLVEAQAQHIARLQARLPQLRDEFQPVPRQG